MKRLGVICPSVQQHILIHSKTFFSLLDTNECQVNKGGCSQICYNTIGSFTCTCEIDFMLDKDNRTCYGKKLSNLLLCMYLLINLFTHFILIVFICYVEKYWQC